MKHLTRILCLLLALVLVLGAAPIVKAEEVPVVPVEKLDIQSEEAARDNLTIGGTAPTVGDSLSNYNNITEREPNNALGNANVLRVGDSVLGATKSSDRIDFYKFTLSATTDVLIASICNRQVMWFALLDSYGNHLVTCSYMGYKGGWHWDGIDVTLDRGTYYIQVMQYDFEGEPAYTRQLDYVLELHAHNFSTHTYPVLPTCYDQGYTVHECSCGTSYNDNFKDPRHTYGPGSDGNYFCLFCGRTSSQDAFRIFGSDRIATSLSIAEHVYGYVEGSYFDTIVVASAANFPDALTGSYLAAVTNAPILLTTPSAQPAIIDYIKERLSSSGTVYILGGSSAVSEGFATELNSLGINTYRLKGSDRYGTNLAILRQAGMSRYDPVIICTGKGFADSLSASATGLPIMMVGERLTGDQISFLNSSSRQFIIIGGTGAVSRSVESQLRDIGSVERIAGSSRYETSVMVAERFFDRPSRAVLAYAKNFPDGLCGGPLAYQMGVPLILTDSNYYAARDYATYVGISNGYVLGGSSLVTDSAVRRIFALSSSASVVPG